MLVFDMGAGRSGTDTHFGPHANGSERAEPSLADFFALMRCIPSSVGVTGYDIRVTIRWDGEAPPLLVRIPERHFGGHCLDGETPSLNQSFVPVETGIDTRVPIDAYLDQLREMVLDVVNQGSVQCLRSIQDPVRDP